MKIKKTVIMIIGGIIALLSGICLVASNRSTDSLQGILFGIGSGLLGAVITDIVRNNMHKNIQKGNYRAK